MLIEILSLFLLIFTSLFGIASLLRLLVNHLFDKNMFDKVISVLPIRGNEEKIEFILRELLSNKHKKIAVIDLGMDSETRQIAEQMALHNKNLSLLNEEMILDYFMGDNV